MAGTCYDNIEIVSFIIITIIELSVHLLYLPHPESSNLRCRIDETSQCPRTFITLNTALLLHCLQLQST